MSNLSLYQQIQPLVQKDARDIAAQVYKELGTQFGVPSVPFHTHNGIDSPQIDGDGLIPFQAVQYANGGVLFNVLNNSQAYSYLGKPYTVPVYNPVYNAPFVIIQGVAGGADSFIGGEASLGTTVIFYTPGTFQELWVRIDNTQQLTLTGTLSGGATSATLDVAWPGVTAILSTTFSNSDVRNVTYTRGSTSITWTGGLSGAASATITTVSKWNGVSLNLSR
jgi:hypothetical protein